MLEGQAAELSVQLRAAYLRELPGQKKVFVVVRSGCGNKQILSFHKSKKKIV